MGKALPFFAVCNFVLAFAWRGVLGLAVVYVRIVSTLAGFVFGLRMFDAF